MRALLVILFGRRRWGSMCLHYPEALRFCHTTLNLLSAGSSPSVSAPPKQGLCLRRGILPQLHQILDRH